MVTRPASNEALNSRDLDLQPVDADEQAHRILMRRIQMRLLPRFNPDRSDRALAWSEWQESCGTHVLMRFVAVRNNTRETDEDIIQDTLLTAYLGVESERYQPREGVPFAAYVIGIARNKIREARRRERYLTDMDEREDEIGFPGSVTMQRQPERVIERRQQREQLSSTISLLPEARRQVLESYLAGASTDEIAGRMAISEELVRQHKCRGLRALQGILG